MLSNLLTNNNNGNSGNQSANANESKQVMSGQPMDPYSAWHAPPSTSVTGTSELFSSTFAMLSDTNTVYPGMVDGSGQWPAKSAGNSFLFEQPAPIQPNGNYETPVRFDAPTQYRQQPYNPAYYPRYEGYNPGNYYQQPPMPQQPQQLLMTPNHVMRPEPLRPRVGSPSPRDDASVNSPALTSTSGSATSSTTPPGTATSNLNGESASTDVETPDEERVMCMACRGVYPSRRSLTGHIGRNEKCREIIGRNYLDAVASGINPPVPGTDAAIKSGAITTGQDGMSPVCPYCDRFISHYKGNIRRHINQCCKNTDAAKRPRMEKGGDQCAKNRKRRKTMDEIPSPFDFPHDEYAYSQPAHLGGPAQPQQLYQPHQMSPSSYYQSGSDLCSPLNSSTPSNGSNYENASDAYICEDCDFVTVYKGNMKRHLNTCHPLPDCKNLKEWDVKLEAMRASNMGIVGEKLQEKLAAHKQNSSRGRKPRKKKENQNSEELQSEPLIEDFKPNLPPITRQDDFVSYAE